MKRGFHRRHEFGPKCRRVRRVTHPRNRDIVLPIDNRAVNGQRPGLLTPAGLRHFGRHERGRALARRAKVLLVEFVPKLHDGVGERTELHRRVVAPNARRCGLLLRLGRAAPTGRLRARDRSALAREAANPPFGFRRILERVRRQGGKREPGERLIWAGGRLHAPSRARVERTVLVANLIAVSLQKQRQNRKVDIVPALVSPGSFVCDEICEPFDKRVAVGTVRAGKGRKAERGPLAGHVLIRSPPQKFGIVRVMPQHVFLRLFVAVEVVLIRERTNDARRAAIGEELARHGALALAYVNLTARVFVVGSLRVRGHVGRPGVQANQHPLDGIFVEHPILNERLHLRLVHPQHARLPHRRLDRRRFVRLQVPLFEQSWDE